MLISTAREIQIKEFRLWLDKEATEVLHPLHGQGKKILDKIEERLSDVREACEKLAEEARREVERGKAGRKAKATEKLAKYFLKQMDKITLPEKMSSSELEKLSRDLEKTFSSISQERSAWFPRISPLFIIARRRVDFALTRLPSPIAELRSFLSEGYSKARTIEEAFLKTDEMMRLLNGLGEYEKQKASAKERIQLLQRLIEESERGFASIKSSAELNNLDEMNQKIQQLRKQVKHELRHLQKPFIKFATLARVSGYALTSEEVEKLGQYLKDPFVALATEEPGYPKLKSTLRRVAQAMDEGRLKLKGSRLKKGREEIDEIVSKSNLDSLHQECVRVFASNQQLLSSKETQVAQSKSEELRGRLEELQRQKELAEASLGELERGQKQMLEKVDGQKKVLEKLAYEGLEKRVDLRF